MDKRKLEFLLSHPSELLLRFTFYISKYLKDETYVKLQYFIKYGKTLNLDTPKTYREKLQWLKLYYHNPDMPIMVDKCAVKKYVSDRIGAEHIIPELGVYERFDDIDFSLLPNKFILKCTHDSGSYVIVHDKLRFLSSSEFKKAKHRIEKGLGRNYFFIHREWPYKLLKPQILVEELLEDKENDYLTDYKFYCFNGEPQIMYVSHDIAKQAHTDFFDMNYNHLPLRMKDPNSENPPQKPLEFEEMKNLARVLSKGLPHVRVDFYIVNHRIYFGELTFFHNGGLFPLYPNDWDYKLGEMLHIPKINNEEL